MSLDITHFEKLYATPTAAASATSAQHSEAFQQSGLYGAISSIASTLGVSRKNADSGSHILENYAYTDAKSGLTFESVRMNYSLGDEFMHDVRITNRAGNRIFDGRHSQVDPSFSEDGQEYSWDVNAVNVPALREAAPVFAELGTAVKTAADLQTQRYRQAVAASNAAKPA